MSDIRFNQWLHQSGTGGVSQVASGAVGVGTTNPLADFYVRGDAQITGILTAGHIAMGSSITFGDNDRIYLGDGTDFQLYHASSDNNSYIVESGAGSLVVNASKFHVKNAANNEDIAVFNQSGNNELYFSNSKKFETTSSGVTVTGGITASGASTFNEDVTFTGATSGRDIAWDKSNDYLMVKDNARIVFGNSGDLSIRHLSSDNTSYVSSTTNNVAHEFNKTKTWTLLTTAAEKRIHCPADSTTPSVEIYYNGSKKLETTNTGAVVTGILTATSFSGGLPIPNEGNDRIITSSGSGAVNAEANLQFDGTNLFMPNELRHLGDPDTKIGFDTDTIKFETAGSERLRIDSSGKIGLGQAPNTKVNAVLSVFAATGDDDASDWGANGIFQLDHSGSAAVNNEVLLLGAVSGAVGQIASGLGFGRESTSNWGTYLSFKTHSTGTSNIDELKERARLKSDGTFQVGYLQPADGSSAVRAAKSALEIKRHYPEKVSGNYWITDRNGTPRLIYCEMETDGGGWMLWNDYNTSQTSMNEALGGSSTGPSGNLSRSYYNNYAFYTVWVKASDIDSTGERLHSFVQLDQDGEIKNIADYGSDFFMEDVGDQFQPDRSDYFASNSSSEYIQMDRAYQPQLGASGWQQFSNGGWQQVYIREKDTRMSPGDHRSLHLVERIYGFDDNGVPRWTVAESMNPLPFWSEFSMHGETADGTSDFVESENRRINVTNSNNGNSVRARAKGVLTGMFEYEFQLGYSWGWSIAALVSSIQVAENLRDGSGNPYGPYTSTYYHASLYNNSSNNLWYPTSRAPWESNDTSQNFSPGNNGGLNVLWRESDGTIKAKAKTNQSHSYTFPTKFAGPLIMVSGTQSPHSTRLDKVWNGHHGDSFLNGRNRWYK